MTDLLKQFSDPSLGQPFICYQCSKPAVVLNKNSRCITCVTENFEKTEADFELALEGQHPVQLTAERDLSLKAQAVTEFANEVCGDCRTTYQRQLSGDALAHVKKLYSEGLKEKSEVPVQLEAAKQTPSSLWAKDGKPDPHGKLYDCERAKLAMGQLTDDQMADAVFIYGNSQPNFEDVVAGTAKMPISYLTAAKERIRWLSRALEKALKEKSDG